MPAPPPPPPMAPAAPPPPVFKPPKGSNDRDALLKSIQKGKKLKKTVTNDKSAPLISGASKTVRSINNNDSVHSNVISPIKNLSSIQMELKKQLANDNRNRGPPPPAPNRNISSEANGFRNNFLKQEKAPNGLHLSQLSLKSVNLNANKPTGLQVNPSSLHRKAKSNANLSTLEISEDSNDSAPARPSFNSGKPNLAPKPPVLNGKPNLTHRKLSKPVSRAHSLKSPRSPSPESQDNNPKFGTVRHMSSIIGPSLANSSTHIARSRPALNSRPTAPPPSIPSSPGQHPAPPPPSKLTAPVKHPNHAPPPPPPSAQIPQAPSHAPPPPPHKTLPPFKPPQPALPIANSNPPPPPPRHSSIREAHGKPAIDLGEKFKDMFRSPDTFPNPPPFRNVIKLYSSKQSQSLKSGFVVLTNL